MSSLVVDFVQQIVNAESVEIFEVIQELWSGYGKILRVKVDDKNVIVKLIDPPKSEVNHPRGWATDISHQRKLKSYQIELTFYQQFARLCDDNCQVASLKGFSNYGNGSIIILEDLDALGYQLRRSNLSIQEVKVCLSWLANFHANFLNNKGEGLWNIGTYWHLDTRPEEFKLMKEGILKQNAQKIDEMLNACKYKTLVHGDAKVANFCFSKDGSKVAAVDFQYVGVGCGMKDIAYLFSSCLDSNKCFEYEGELLEHYFYELKLAIDQKQHSLNTLELEEEWRCLYSFAWADFARFLLGWMPTHHKLHEYSLNKVEDCLKEV